MKHQKDKLTLEEASERLQTMTPEEWVDHMEYVQSIELGLPEVPASINARVSMPNGTDAQITLRDWDEDNLLIRFNKLIDEIQANGGEVQKRPATPEELNTKEVRITSDVDANVIEDDDVELFEVSSIAYMSTSTGKPYFMVRGGVWKKYGWKAWPEVVPEDVNTEQWNFGDEITTIPESMRYAYVNKGVKKIVAFAA